MLKGLIVSRTADAIFPSLDKKIGKITWQTVMHISGECVHFFFHFDIFEHEFKTILRRFSFETFLTQMSTFRVIHLKYFVLRGLQTPDPVTWGLRSQAPEAFGLKLKATVSCEILVYVSQSGSQNLLKSNFFFFQFFFKSENYFFMYQNIAFFWAKKISKKIYIYIFTTITLKKHEN